MKILVTGGAGFIGSHLVDALVKQNHSVMVIDNLSTGFKKNINTQATFEKIDITNFQKVENFFKKNTPEIVFHLAAQIDVRKSVADPVFDARVNILGSLNLIRLAHQYKVKKFIFASTGGAIYGDTEQRPTPADHPEHPLSPYGIAKLSVDKYLYYFHKIHGLKYCSLRFGNVYGPRQNPHGEAGVVAIFLNRMLQGQQPIINGPGKQTRDYVFVDDVVAANLAALKKINQNGVFNIGTGQERSVNDLFFELNRHFPTPFKRVCGPAKLGEQKTSCLDWSNTKQRLNWEPKISLEQGIETTYQWFAANH